MRRRHSGRGACALALGGLLVLGAPALPAHAADAAAVSAVTPSAVRPGATVVVTGSALETASAVWVGDAAAAFQLRPDGALDVVVPAAAVSAPVLVDTAGGRATGPVLTVVPPPAPLASLAARVGAASVEVRWAGGGSAGAVVRALSGTTPPASPSQGRHVHAGIGSAVVDRSATPGEQVAYAAWALDSDGVTSTSARTLVVPTGRATPARADATVTPRTVTAGAATVVAVTARYADGAPLGSGRVEVQTRRGGTGSWVVAGSGTTSGAGVARVRVVPRFSSALRVVVRDTEVSGQAVRDVGVVHVRPRVVLQASPGAVLAGQRVTLRGTLAPAASGVRVTVQERVGTAWRAVGTATTTATGTFALPPLGAGRAGTRAFRAATAARVDLLSATSAVAGLTVDSRDLRVGHRGADVLRLERALLAVKADVGRVDGVFDEDLRHAVVAFQKSQGLPRTGRYEGTTRTRLASPRPVRARHPAKGRSVEVDLTKQVLYLFEAGALRRVVDVSTGNGAPYYVDGVRRVARTPEGRFAVTRRIDGIRVSHLGRLYRPAYFVGGYAVHGSPSVPPHPASHGCVRVTNSSMDRLFGLLLPGTPVAVYGS